MPTSRPTLTARRAASEVALLVAAGVFMGLLGPFGTDRTPYQWRALYWAILIIGGGAIGIAIDVAVARRLRRFWPRLAADSVLMTPGVTVLVLLVAHWMYGADLATPGLTILPFQVFVISLGVTALRLLTWREAEVRIETPAETAEADPTQTFRKRLSARRRGARLVAIKAEDHYLRVYTDAGEELVTARFADALAELAAAPGFRTHRSWWVAASAIESVRWRRGSGEARLGEGLVAPVSRREAAALKMAGWR